MTAGVFEQFEPYRPVEDNRKPKEQPEAAPPPENEGGRLQSAPDQRERTSWLLRSDSHRRSRSTEAASH